MCSNSFWSGIVIGTLTGVYIGKKMQGREKNLKRAIHRTARKLEDAIDSLNR